jgi:phosphatidylethanolamine/phosphatidyl-N-methylethanolamine N-methyltransferase
MEINTIEKPTKMDSGLRLFLKELISNPSAMGAACPSSKRLAHYIAEEVPVDAKHILELGAGTGAVTAALVEHGIPVQHLAVIERAEPLAKHLQERFPQLAIIQGDAIHLSELLPTTLIPIDVVVSSLPLRSLPENTVSLIGKELEKILKPNGLFIQFTYGLHSKPFPPSNKLKLLDSKHVWLNIPPARVEIFEYKQ